ncbi:MAG: aminopeptidase [Eubacteriaceae bacterium]|nr:aminopeptidase [Eubacteriaceae bacterium]
MNELIRIYKECLNAGKTERECIRLATAMAEEAGYINLNECISENRELKAGDKVYASYNEKTMAMFHIGNEDLEKGMNILGAHVDSPRIDVKQNPLYEEEGMAFLDTHYYGGIKNYQWVTIPLALHGVIVKKDGTRVNVVIGEKEDDPVFAISDLLIHLSREQMSKTASKVIEGEKLDLLIGTEPIEGEEKDAVKKNILSILKDMYDVEEADLLSAELEIVPAGKARDMGLDRSMVMAYGQDDRICAFTSLFAMLDIDTPDRTACCLLVDKEEIGSYGASGMQSRFFENAVAEIMLLTGHAGDISVRRSLSNSNMLSSDVNAAFDPLFPEVFEKKNSSFLSKGLVFSKFTGSGGKSGSNDSNAEYIAALRNVMDLNDVKYQFAELGRVDAGGGGTIAYITAQYGMEVIDSGLAILCMHAPMEISSKADICEAVKGYKAFLTQMK